MSGKDERPVRKKTELIYPSFTLEDWDLNEAALNSMEMINPWEVRQQSVPRPRFCPYCHARGEDIELYARIHDSIDDTLHYAFVCSACGNVIRVTKDVRRI